MSTINGTVLVVDDEITVRSLYRSWLERLGLKVLEAGNGAEAEALLAATDGVKLLITDVLMPVMDGPTLVEKVLPAHPGLRVLYVSGSAVGNPKVEEHCRERGCDFLAKPFEGAALTARVRHLLAPLGNPIPE
jgi:two-component system, cell cycle sensor histidine kinase and response regulator CckA